MSLDKSIQHGKERRKPYYRSGKFDRTCRPNGGCSYCEMNRMHKNKKKECACKAQIDDVYLMDDVDKAIQKYWEHKHTEHGTQEKTIDGKSD